ncbi:hypothetical protein BDC45DRAFT_505628 [Circinella umbellata]|nr:hypothetical protein BDC45DRAFT_505628 [Circinella umbellata]
MFQTLFFPNGVALFFSAYYTEEAYFIYIAHSYFLLTQTTIISILTDFYFFILHK